MEPFFLSTSSGSLFCVLYPGISNHGVPKKRVLLVPPLFEELNKSRRMIALQCRHLAQHGIDVLHVDLFGTGDSEGVLCESSWEIWHSNLQEASRWYESERGPIDTLWLVRGGALLGAGIALSGHLRSLLYWQPVMSGTSYVNQLIRLRIANTLDRQATPPTREEILAEIDQTGTLCVAGYEIPDSIITGLSTTLPATPAIERTLAIHWFDITSSSTQQLSRGNQRAVQNAGFEQHDLHITSIQAPPFWHTQEITEVPELLDTTLKAISPK